MRLDRFTIKAQEALQTAQTIATEAQNPELGIEHLMLSLIKQADGIVTPIFQKLGVDIQGITSALEDVVQKSPKVQGQVRICVSPHPYNPFWRMLSKRQLR